jgi:nitrite reductase/ring-hydroxylating ferredoxin subunit
MLHLEGMNDIVNSSDVPFTAVAKVGSIPVGEGRVFEVSGRLVAVFFDGDRYSAIDDGAWCDNPQLKVDVFETRVAGDLVEVRVPPAKPVELPTTGPR